MTVFEQARAEILKSIVLEYLRTSVRSNRSLYFMREGLKEATKDHRDFVVWGPEILDRSTLMVTVLGWEKPITLQASNWCARHRDTEMPLTP